MDPHLDSHLDPDLCMGMCMDPIAHVDPSKNKSCRCTSRVCRLGESIHSHLHIGHAGLHLLHLLHLHGSHAHGHGHGMPIAIGLIHASHLHEGAIREMQACVW